MKQKRNSIVLMVTIMLMLLLSALISTFLQHTDDTKKSVTKIFAAQQTNYLMYNILHYIQNLTLDEKSLFYASKVAYPLRFDNTNIIIHIYSQQSKINLNSYLASMKENQEAKNNFLSYLRKNKLHNPNFFLNLLLDSIDKDYDSRNGNNSEIALEYPTFRNGRIYNKEQLQFIKDYYFFKTGDDAISDLNLSKIFSLRNSAIDLNFISTDVARLLFDDANDYSLKLLTEHIKLYKKMTKLPFDEYYIKSIEKGRYGQHFILKSSIAHIVIDLHYKTQFTSKSSFDFTIKTKKLSYYQILSL